MAGSGEPGGEAGRRPCTLTGRGSDRVRLRAAARRDRPGARRRPRRRATPRDRSRPGGARGPRVRLAPGPVATGRLYRSDEHTSELQSPYDLVCRLILVKKILCIILISLASMI